jgi:hypothetical protein
MQQKLESPHMSTDDLAHLDWLARIDALKERLAEWAAQPVEWEPLRPAQSLVHRLLERLEPLRLRWEAPLVVATFGGTGTGKSSLVNALVGDEVTPSGKERPTTRRPILLAHTDADLKSCQIPLDDVDLIRRDLPLLRDILLLDCPDPDTSETDGETTNLGRLHELLPLCDVLLYVSTQQKYRSAKVGDELGKAAESCRLVFIQTHADLDSDIRDDWRTQLEPHYRIADMFFVDSRQALAEQRSGQQPTGEFGRLLTFLARELAASRRAGIRRANLLDLLDQGLTRGTALVEPSLPSLGELETAIETERKKLGQALAAKMTEELSTCRSLWQRRLLEQVTQSWGVSPFAGLLRLYQAQATLLASWSLTRARSTAQLALWGAWQGARWIGQRHEQQADEQRLNRLSDFGIDPAMLRAAELTLAGYLHAAHFRNSPVRTVAENAGRNYLAEVSQRLDAIIANLAKRNSGWLTRFVFEIGFAILPAFLLYRIGRNFFYDSFVLDRPLLDLNFYVPAALFLCLWSAFWLWRFLARLRRGVQAEIGKLSASLADAASLEDVFADKQRLCETARLRYAELLGLQQSAAALRMTLESDSRLGGRTTDPGRPEQSC